MAKVKRRVLLLAVVLILDIGGTTTLFFAQHDWCHPPTNGTVANATYVPCPRSAREFFQGFSHFGFQDTVQDLICLVLGRLLILATGLKYATTINPRSQNKPAGNGVDPAGGKTDGKGGISINSGDIQRQPRPLPDRDTSRHGVSGRTLEEGANRTKEQTAGAGMDNVGASRADEPGDTQGADMQEASRLRNNIMKQRTTVAVLFLLMTAMQMYIGVKCVQFRFIDTASAITMCLTVVWINAE